MPIIKKHESYFISAGEVSGDLLGADLALAIRELLPRLVPFGISGPAMENAGVQPIASIEDLSVMGVFEVAKRIGDLRMLETRVLHRIEQLEPNFAILIDNPGFHMRLAEQLQLRGVRVFQYVAPKLWAWGEGRAASLKRNFDMVLGILPFEEGFFTSRGINYQYVGSPLKDRTDKVMVERNALGIDGNRPLIACLPGSRTTEIARILPIIVGIKDRVSRSMGGNVEFIVPVPANIDLDRIADALWDGDAKGQLKPFQSPDGRGPPMFECSGLKFVQGMSLEIMAAADVAVVASGTATLECALLGTPMVVVYAMNDLTYHIAKRAVKIPYVSLVNLLADRKLVNEYIQDFSLDDVAADVLDLIRNDDRRSEMLRRFEDMRDRLKGSAAPTAARAIVDACSKPRAQQTNW